MAYERKCENWLSTFGKWVTPVCESPSSFIMWTGLFVLSSVLRRRVRVPKALLGKWAADPNLYVFFIGHAGRVRKTTTMGPAQELLESLSGITEAPEIITKEDLLKKMAHSPDGSMYIFSPEFSEFVAKSGPSMYSFLTNMYDGKKKIISSTIGRTADVVSNPCVNLLAATTPAWVAENMSESVIGGGFASRVIFVYEDEVRQRRMFYRKVLKEIGPQLDEWKLALEADLAHINETIAGDFDISEELEEWFEDWYISHAKDGRNKPKLSGYYERRPAHIIKVAMLLHIAYSDDLVLNKTDFEMAIDIVTSIERNLPRVFESVGKNPYSADMGTILEYVVEKKRCTRSEIRREFSGSASPTTLEELVDGLVASELLLFPSYDEVVDGNGKKEKRFYLEPNYKLLGIIENG